MQTTKSPLKREPSRHSTSTREDPLTMRATIFPSRTESPILMPKLARSALISLSKLVTFSKKSIPGFFIASVDHCLDAAHVLVPR